MSDGDPQKYSVDKDQCRKKYLVNEIFFSIQGEGNLMGTPMVFLRFAECNLRCSIANAGFDCDTEFASYRELDVFQILTEAEALNPAQGWMLLTGGEPALQIDPSLVHEIKLRGWKIAIETNGTVQLPDGIDWICVSPKTAEHTLRQRKANEVKYVRRTGMALPVPSIEADYYLISPAFQANGSVAREDMEWCVNLVKHAPQKWRLTLQTHKLLGVR